MNLSLGFIILRHVTNSNTNMYWIECYHSIRKLYPENPILIIDDNSNKDYIHSIILYNTIVISSEYPYRGEILPYYYYYKYKFCDTVVILHDSVFLNKKIDFDTTSYKFLWNFTHDWDQVVDENNMLQLFNDPALIELHQNKSKWTGCFGGMSVIHHDFLKKVFDKYDLTILLNHITNRHHRMSFERVIACILTIFEPSVSIFGNIHRYTKWGITFEEKDKYSHQDIIKIWSGR